MKNGFTIIELVISIFILSVAVVGIYSGFSIMTILTADTADRLTATYLIQEGMEIVRNIRDTNWLNMQTGTPPGAAWLDGLKNCSAGCEADYTTGTNASGAYAMSPWASRHLYNNANGFYNYNNTGTKTKFERKITISCLDSNGNADSLCASADYIIKVIMQVSWDEKSTILHGGFSADNCGAYNCVKAEWTLYDWYNYAQE